MPNQLRTKTKVLSSETKQNIKRMTTDNTTSPTPHPPPQNTTTPHSDLETNEKTPNKSPRPQKRCRHHANQIDRQL